MDLDSLLRHFGEESGFWQELADRAAELNLVRPLYYAVRYAMQILDTSVPAQMLRAAESRPPIMLRRLVDALFLRALRPDRACAADVTPPRPPLSLRSRSLAAHAASAARVSSDGKSIQARGTGSVLSCLANVRQRKASRSLNARSNLLLV